MKRFHKIIISQVTSEASSSKFRCPFLISKTTEDQKEHLVRKASQDVHEDVIQLRKDNGIIIIITIEFHILNVNIL